MPDIEGTDMVSSLPDWARRIHEAHGSPSLDNLQDVFHGPLSERRAGLRKDDLLEIMIDSRALSVDTDNIVRGMLLGTTRNAVEIMDSEGVLGPLQETSS